MSRFQILDARRSELKLRIGMTGATNCGKTFSSLLIAAGLVSVEDKIDWSKIVLIDTERKRALMVVGKETKEITIGSFKHCVFDPPYNPTELPGLLKMAADIVGEDGVIILDSLTHFWNGSGGLLEIVDEKTKKSTSKNSFVAWGGKDGGTAIQNDMIQAIMSAPCHTICTFRQSMEYTQEKGSDGRTVITKQGIKPVQRGDLEYEFDITLKCQNDHSMEIVKDVTFLGENGQIIEPATVDLGKRLNAYAKDGVALSEIRKQERENVTNNILSMVQEVPDLKPLVQQALNGRKLADVEDLGELKAIRIALQNTRDLMKK